MEVAWHFGDGWVHFTGASGGGKTAPFGHQEPIGRNAESSVVVKTAPTSSFIMSQSEFLFQFLVIALDNPTMFGQSHQILQLHIFGQSGKPVLDRFGFLARPFDEEPFRGTRFTAPVIAMSRTDAPRGKTGVQPVPSTFSPAHGFPCRKRQTYGQLTQGDWLVASIAAQQLGRSSDSFPLA